MDSVKRKEQTSSKVSGWNRRRVWNGINRASEDYSKVKRGHKRTDKGTNRRDHKSTNNKRNIIYTILLTLEMELKELNMYKPITKINTRKIIKEIEKEWR